LETARRLEGLLASEKSHSAKLVDFQLDTSSEAKSVPPKFRFRNYKFISNFQSGLIYINRYLYGSKRLCDCNVMCNLSELNTITNSVNCVQSDKSSNKMPVVCASVAYVSVVASNPRSKSRSENPEKEPHFYRTELVSQHLHSLFTISLLRIRKHLP
jgi:hypothetical protein